MTTTKYPYDKPSIGLHVDESSGSADRCNTRTVQFAAQYGFEYEITLDDLEDSGQALSELADDAVSFLNDLETRPYLSWLHEDNSLFLSADIDGAKEDVGFVSGGEDHDPEDSDYPAADYRGEWLHVNDHGNCTLYVREDGFKDVEIWSVV